MPGKLKVYGKKGGAVVSDAFGKLSDSPIKKAGDGYQSLESAEALVITDAADVGDDCCRRAPLKSKGSNARFTKRENAKPQDRERSAFEEWSRRISRELPGDMADDDQLLGDRIERIVDVS